MADMNSKNVPSPEIHSGYGDMSHRSDALSPSDSILENRKGQVISNVEQGDDGRSEESRIVVIEPVTGVASSENNELKTGKISTTELQVSSNNTEGKETSQSRQTSLIRPPTVISGSGAQKEKKREPQSVVEYIEFFYNGKFKTLPESVVQKLTGGSTNISPEARSSLLNRARETDISLEKTRLLMQVSRSARQNKVLESCLSDFAADVVAFHPVFHGSELARSLVFSSAEENIALVEIWSALYRHEKEGREAKAKRENIETVIDQGMENPAEGKNSTEKDYAKNLAKARRNVFLCAVLWRHANGVISFGDVMRVLRETILRVKLKPANIEEELLELLLSAASSDAEKIGLYAEWANQYSLFQTKRATLLEQTIEKKDRDIDELGKQLTEQQSQISEKNEMLENLNEKLGLLENEVSVQRMRARADYEKLRATCLGILRKDVTELENVEIGLSRPIPKVEAAREVVNAVVDSINSYIKDLEGKR